MSRRRAAGLMLALAVTAGLAYVVTRRTIHDGSSTSAGSWSMSGIVTATHPAERTFDLKSETSTTTVAVDAATRYFVGSTPSTDAFARLVGSTATVEGWTEHGRSTARVIRISAASP